MSKRLYKSRDNRVLCGVCGGIGEYFNIDPVIVRIILVVLCCVGFSGIIAYIIAACIVPEKPVMMDPDPRSAYENTYKKSDIAVDAEIVDEKEQQADMNIHYMEKLKDSTDFYRTVFIF